MTPRLRKLLYFCTSFLFCSSSFAAQPQVQGHRGSRGTLPENTLPAFDAAIQAGTDVLELDLHLTADGVVIIHHDFFTRPHLYKYLDGKAVETEELITSLKLEELKKFDCGFTSDPKFPQQQSVTGTQIPTLQELFDWILASSHPHAKNIRLNLELKRDPRFPHYSWEPAEFARRVVDLVRINHFDDRVYYSSFDPEMLTQIRHLDDQATLGYIYNQRIVEFVDSLFFGYGMEYLLNMATSLNVKFLSPEHSILKSLEDVQALQQRGFQVIPWTLNEPKRWKELLDMRVDGLITDYPEQLIHYLKNQ